MINGNHKLEEFKLEVTDNELFLTHPNCAFTSSFAPKFPPYHYVKLLQEENTQLKGLLGMYGIQAAKCVAQLNHWKGEELSGSPRGHKIENLEPMIITTKLLKEIRDAAKETLKISRI